MRGTSLDRSNMKPFAVKLGTETYSINVLTWEEADAWSSAVADQFVKVTGTYKEELLNPTEQGPRSFVGAASKMFFKIPGEIVKAFQSYDLQKVVPDEAFKKASPEQINEAFTTLLEVVFPFTSSIGQLSQALRAMNLIM